MSGKQITQQYNNTMLTMQQQQSALEQKQNDISNAYNKVEMLGYADNETAVILGVTPGTPAASVRQAALDKINQIDLYKTQTDEQIRATQADYDMQNTVGMDIYQKKSDVDLLANKRPYKIPDGRGSKRV